MLATLYSLKGATLTLDSATEAVLLLFKPGARIEVALALTKMPVFLLVIASSSILS
ncbi:hypothetical protein D3C87_2169850 [compost metagenome]